MHNYQKRYTDNVGGFVIDQLRDDGTIREVSFMHSGFTDWLKYNLLPEVPYVEPPAPEPIVIEDPDLPTRVALLEEAVMSLIAPST